MDEAVRPAAQSARAPWHNLRWRFFLPLVFAANMLVATLAWIIVSIIR
jgi:hypothetical protein